MLHRATLDPKELVYPIHDDVKTLRLAHMLSSLHEPRLLRRPPLQTLIVIINRKDLVTHSIYQEQLRAIRRVERAVVDEREFLDPFFLEGLQIFAISPFVRQSVGEIERVFEVVYSIEPAWIEDVMTASSVGDDAC